MSERDDTGRAIFTVAILAFVGWLMLFWLTWMEGGLRKDLELRLELLEEIHPATHGEHGGAR